MRSFIPKLALLTALAAAVPLGACSQGTRADTLHAAFVTVDSAHSAWLVYDKDQDAKVTATAVATAKSLADGKAVVDAWRAKSDKVQVAYVLALHALAAAWGLNDDASLTGARRAVADVLDAIAAAGGAK